ncbi:MAG: flagellar biosynthesis/type III secretory pathway M-ring protein FliF/YscJ [Planctomycetaceae bacterium]|jgi:flagellar biosynthesis/type III secretory pathway M-ring protein FliF/YscJ
MTDISEFITGFMVWVAQFVVVSTVLLVVTHLFARKRRERKRVAQLQAEEQSNSTELVEEPEPVRAG